MCAGVDESRAAHIAYPIMMMLHGVVMHRLLNKKQGPLGRAIAAACLDACMTLLESARQGNSVLRFKRVRVSLVKRCPTRRSSRYSWSDGVQVAASLLT